VSTLRRTVVDLLRWAALGVASGVLAGVACWAFLTALDRATEARLDHGWLVWLLPVAGLAIGGAYHLFGGRAGAGNALLLDEIHQPTAWVPRRMAPMVAVGTVASHLFGASVGREGTALQMSGSLSDWMARAFGLGHEDRRVLLTASLGAGFGAVFGVPLAGLVFGLEVQRVSWTVQLQVAEGRHARRTVWLHLVIATVVGSFVGNEVVHGLGHDHVARPDVHVAIDAALLGRAAVAGVIFGLAALAFIESTDVVRAGFRRAIPWAPARPAVGGLLVLVGVALVGRDYLGLSLPLLDEAVLGADVSISVPLLKLAFTVVCLGAGFIGGEVTPLFVIGATTGAAVAPTLGLPPLVGAAIGFVAVFGAAANTPIACIVMAFELFGVGVVPPAAVACAVAYACSGRRGIYPSQRRTHGAGSIAVHEVPGLHNRLRSRRRPPTPP
jgi:H+/Cl- antiporter ClcA